MRALLTEDDMLIGDGIKTSFSKVGFSVGWFTQDRQGKEALCSAPYDAVIPGLTSLGIDGRDISREWREEGQRGPVSILAACDTLAERVEGLRLGADDYLYKPFALIEVAARLEALMRRTNGQTSNEPRHGSVVLGPDKHVATLAGGPLTLKPEEFTLLELLMHNAGRVLPRKLIEGRLYIWDEKVTSNAVEVHVRHLRCKLDNDFIRTVHGVGYILSEK